MALPQKLPGGGLRFHGWEFTSNSKAHIMPDADSDDFSADLALPQIPEEVYADNFLNLKMVQGGAEVKFNAHDALGMVDAKNDLVKVSYANEWAAARAGASSEYEVLKPYDWTFTTPYKGTYDPAFKISETEEQIDMKSLMVKEKILFFDSINLYGDDFGDNGDVMLNVKVRVMPSSFFVLQRLFVRVDRVLVRIIDTRLWHRFGTKYLIRHSTTCESSAADLEKKLGGESKLAYNKDMLNNLIPHLNEVELKNERVELA